MTGNGGDTEHKHIETITRLEAALEGEREQSASLRSTLEALERKVAEVESRLDQRLEEAIARAASAESQLAEQGARLKTLGEGREQSMLALNNARDELRIVTAERDQIRQQLTDVEGMQTETATFDDGMEDETGSAARPSRAAADANDGLPSIEELMANLGSDDRDVDRDGFGQARVDAGEEPADEAAWQEMISPDLIVAGPGKGLGGSRPAIGALSRKLVAFGEDETQEYLLDQELMTIGRSESADIQIEGEFISRIHARLLMIGADVIIEDAGSKNGINVNSEKVERHTLRHGDLVRVGSVRFRYVDEDRDG